MLSWDSTDSTYQPNLKIRCCLWKTAAVSHLSISTMVAWWYGQVFLFFILLFASMYQGLPCLQNPSQFWLTESTARDERLGGRWGQHIHSPSSPPSEPLWVESILQLSGGPFTQLPALVLDEHSLPSSSLLGLGANSTPVLLTWVLCHSFLMNGLLLLPMDL